MKFKKLIMKKPKSKRALLRNKARIFSEKYGDWYLKLKEPGQPHEGWFDAYKDLGGKRSKSDFMEIVKWFEEHIAAPWAGGDEPRDELQIIWEEKIQDLEEAERIFYAVDAVTPIT